MSFDPKPLPTYHRDPFHPVVFGEVTPYNTTQEQNDLMRDVLTLCASDSFFAVKAYNAILFIIGRSGQIPILNTVEPASKVTNSPTFKLKCKGSGYSPASVILINGNAQLTSYVSGLEITCDISLVGVAPAVLPVVVKSGEGVLSNSKTLTVTASEIVAEEGTEEGHAELREKMQPK